MYEFTHKGLWFDWARLDRTDKKLAGTSLAMAAIAALPLSLITADYGYRVGFKLGSGGTELRTSGIPEIFGDVFPWLHLLAAVGMLISGIIWWLFSRRQDEMFNRVQNYAVGYSAAWTMGMAFLWWIASIGGLIPSPPFVVLAVVCLVLLTFFWLQAVRKWA